MMACFDCGGPASHQHHVVPRSLGGTATVALCERCHGLVHSREFTGHRRLTATAMQHKKSRGEYTGGAAPYGWRVADDGVNLLPHTWEQRAILRARDLREAGLSLEKVGARLEAEGLLPRSGGRWHAKTVRDLLAARAAWSVAA